MQILLTGAAGFIGSHLLEALLDRGHQIVAVDNLDDYYDPAVKRANLRAVRGEFRFMERDVRDPALEEAFRDTAYSVVVHLAGRVGVRASVTNPALYFDVNVNGTRHVLDLALRHGTPRVVLASTSAVYGAAPTPFDEEQTVPNPISVYGASKLSAEALVRAYHISYGLRAQCLRFFTAYGPRQRPDMAIHGFARRVVAGEPVPIFGPGDSRRSYTYIDDIVEGVVRAVEKDEAFEIYNLGGGHAVVLLEMVEMLARALGRPARIRHEPAHPADPPATHAAIRRARERLGWEPRVPFEEGLRRFARWFLGG